jgi:sodium/proline symporter/sodium/pantothenate symporter
MTGWLLLAAAAAALAAWGWRHGGSATAFFAASRSAGPVVAGLAGTAAGLSAFVFVGGPSYLATAGAASLWIILSAPVTGALQCWAVGEPIVELVRRHRCLTVPELLAARYGGGWPQGLAALAIAAGATATLAVQVRGAAVLGPLLFDAPGWQVALAALAATIAYTAAGGMRAGLPAEAAQGAIMAAAAVAFAAAALIHAGGPQAAVAAIAAHRPALLEPFGPDGGTAAMGLFLLFGLGTCAQPHYLQKFLLLRDRAALRWMPLVMTAALLAILTVWLGVGAGGTALWLEGGLELRSPDELAPAVLAAIRSPSLTLLTMVAVVAAIMSTAASLLNIAAAALTRDLPAALGRSATAGVGPARLATVGVGLAAAVLAAASERPIVLLGVLGWGTFTAALLPVMVIGLNWSGSTRRGAVAALIVGPAVQLALEAGRLAGSVGPSWEPGLTGAAAGTAALVLLSGAGRGVRERAAP